MIKAAAQAVLEDVNGVNNVTMDVNFDEEHKDCIKFTLDEKEAIIKYTDVFAVMFTLATKEAQAKMMPVRQELGTEYMKEVTIKCTKDMKEGELIKVNVRIHVPTVIAESEAKKEDEQLTDESGTL